MSKDNFFNMVVGVCSNHFKISKEVIRGHSRKREIVDARFIAILIMTLLEEYTLETIGLFFSGRDHSTISNARKQINLRLAIYSRLKLGFEYCEKKAKFLLGQSKDDPDQMYLFMTKINENRILNTIKTK